MNERTVQLYEKALHYAYVTLGSGQEHPQFAAVVAGRFAELIIKDCADMFDVEYGTSELTGEEAAISLRLHFGVKK